MTQTKTKRTGLSAQGKAAAMCLAQIKGISYLAAARIVAREARANDALGYRCGDLARTEGGAR